MQKYMPLFNEISFNIKIEINSFCYDKKKEKYFENQKFTFYPGNLYYLQGKNGAGKTTFLNLLFGKLNFDGKIFVNDTLIENHDVL